MAPAGVFVPLWALAVVFRTQQQDNLFYNSAQFHNKMIVFFEKTGCHRVEQIRWVLLKSRDNFAYFSIKTCCGYSLELPRRGDSNEYPQHVYGELMKISFEIVIRYLPFLFHSHNLPVFYSAMWRRLSTIFGCPHFSDF